MTDVRRATIPALVATLLLLALPAPARADVAVDLTATGLSKPDFVTAPPGDSRLFVVEKTGRIRILESGKVTATFLDLSGSVSGGSEQGLLGMAFHPGYPADPRFYVDYTDRSGNTRVVEYRTSADPDRADPATARVILTVTQPYSNHNGGMLAFGPDGYLYVGLGDGGSAGDPQGNGQNPRSLLGSLLRIDVDHGSPYTIPASNPFIDGKAGAPEVWVYGLRNPWRFSFDGNSLYVADVGQNAWEEVDVLGTADGGANFGWNAMEGTHCYHPSTGCSTSNKTLPVLEYGHAEGCSITGGYVYRGSDLPEVAGDYFYGDYCSGWLRSFRYSGGSATATRDWTAELGTYPGLTSFGTGGSGELYFTTLGGNLYRLVPGATRLFGADRYATSTAISAATFSPGIPVAYIATGTGFADALAGGAAAGHAGGPVLLVRPDALPSSVATELRRLRPAEIVVLGGTGAVSNAVVSALSAIAPTRRVSGADRYATAAAAALDAFSSPVPTAYVATGLDFPDALAGAAAAVAKGAPLLLTRPDRLPSVTRTALAALHPGGIVVLGGTGAVSDAVVSALSAIAPTRRVSGADRYATAAAISRDTYPGGTNAAYAATGTNFPDALAGSVAAGRAGAPMLLVTGSSIPSATRTELTRLTPSTVVALGGAGAVSAQVSADLAGFRTP